jgi:hypothetical protein
MVHLFGIVDVNIFFYELGITEVWHRTKLKYLTFWNGRSTTYFDNKIAYNILHETN